LFTRAVSISTLPRTSDDRLVGCTNPRLERRVSVDRDVLQPESIRSTAIDKPMRYGVVYDTGASEGVGPRSRWR
jgi:hypothetical protein